MTADKGPLTQISMHIVRVYVVLACQTAGEHNGWPPLAFGLR